MCRVCVSTNDQCLDSTPPEQQGVALLRAEYMRLDTEYMELIRTSGTNTTVIEVALQRRSAAERRFRIAQQVRERQIWGAY